MPLRDFFRGDPKYVEYNLKLVLDDGLSAAETGQEPKLKSGIEYRDLLLTGQIEPLFLNEVERSFREIFEKWLNERRDRINKVLERASSPEREIKF